MARSKLGSFEVDDDLPTTGSIARLPNFSRIPLPSGPIRVEEAELAYWKWGQILHSRGLLTDETMGWITSLVSYMEELARCRAKGSSIRYAQQGIDSALRKLNSLYDSSPISTSESANPYAHFGFAQRARHRRHGQD